MGEDAWTYLSVAIPGAGHGLSGAGGRYSEIDQQGQTTKPSQ